MINAELVERTSKTGKKYIAIEVTIADKITKLVFLTQAEVELIKLLSSTQHK